MPKTFAPNAEDGLANLMISLSTRAVGSGFVTRPNPAVAGGYSPDDFVMGQATQFELHRLEMERRRGADKELANRGRRNGRHRRRERGRRRRSPHRRADGPRGRCDVKAAASRFLHEGARSYLQSACGWRAVSGSERARWSAHVQRQKIIPYGSAKTLPLSARASFQPTATTRTPSR
jgi:hypothetical protein